MWIYPFLLSILKASEEDKQNISAICRNLRSESELIFNLDKIECHCCTGKEHKTVSKITSIKETINPYIFPKITTRDFGCSENTYVTHLTNLAMFLFRICAVIKEDMPFDYYPDVLVSQQDPNNIPCLLQYIKKMSGIICTSSISVSSNDALHQDLDILKDIKDNVCYAKSPDLIEDEVHKIKKKYQLEIAPPEHLRMIFRIAREITNNINALPEIKWLILLAFLDVHENDTFFENSKLFDILILLCAIDSLESHPTVLENGKSYNLNANSAQILRVCIENILNVQKNIIYNPYLNFFQKIEHLFSSTTQEIESKHLFRAYIFAFLTDYNLCSRYDTFFDSLLSYTSKYNFGQHDNTFGANATSEPDEIIYTIFKTYDRIFRHIINNFF